MHVFCRGLVFISERKYCGRLAQRVNRKFKEYQESKHPEKIKKTRKGSKDVRLEKATVDSLIESGSILSIRKTTCLHYIFLNVKLGFFRR